MAQVDKDSTSTGALGDAETIKDNSSCANQDNAIDEHNIG